MEEREQIEVTQYDVVTGESSTVEVTQVNWTAGKEDHVGPWALCHICGRAFPKRSLVKVRGKFYCTDDVNEVQ